MGSSYKLTRRLSEALDTYRCGGSNCRAYRVRDLDYCGSGMVLVSMCGIHKGGVMKQSLYLLGLTSLIAIMVLCGGCASMPDFPNKPTTVDLSWLEQAMQWIDGKVPQIIDQPEDEYNPPGMPPYVPAKIQISRSWESGAAWREHNEGSDGVPFASYKKHVDEKKDDGCNTINLYLFNMRDGAPVPTTFYANGGFGGAVSPERVAAIRKKIEYAYSVGMQVNIWMLPDDGGFPVKDEKAVKQYFADCKEHFGDLIEKATYIVVCLEADEVFGSGGIKWLNSYAMKLEELFPKASIANHMKSGNYSWSVECRSIDVHFHQVNPRKSIQACEDELKNVVANCPKPVMACEVSLHGKSDEAREKAKRALAAGCIGVHSGVPKK